MTGIPPTGSADAGTRLLLDLRSEIARADSKASVLVAALGMTAGVISGWLAGSEWRPSALSGPGSALWWTGIGGLAMALLSLLMAVLPRYRGSTWAPGAPLTYFADIHRAARQNRLAEALDATDSAPAAGHVTALTETSRIAVRKHQWIRVGLLAYSVGAVLLPASLLLG
ncbi:MULTISPECIES: Pycsar system effector family protein [unclassified Streptomyces]|uniref:Pycsar system effector family protein n=1 Tax=unclassified Streptomyces TaxID=2593676 RepID=UPI0036EAA92C